MVKYILNESVYGNVRGMKIKVYGLMGKKIILTGSRRSEEMDLLIKKQGGTAITRPIQGDVILEENQVKLSIKKLIREPIDWIILTTGIGTETIFNIADEMGLGKELRGAFRGAKIAVRGYKTQNALKKFGFIPTIRDQNGTMQDLIHALDAYHITGKRIAAQLYGDTIPELDRFLERKKAIYFEILPYRYLSPDPRILQIILRDICNKTVDATAFTSALQVRNLFNYAVEQEMLQPLQDALNEDVLAVAVGKVTADALKEAGITRVVKPERERMGAMIMAMDNYFRTIK